MLQWQPDKADAVVVCFCWRPFSWPKSGHFSSRFSLVFASVSPFVGDGVYLNETIRHDRVRTKIDFIQPSNQQKLRVRSRPLSTQTDYPFRQRSGHSSKRPARQRPSSAQIRPFDKLRTGKTTAHSAHFRIPSSAFRIRLTSGDTSTPLRVAQRRQHRAPNWLVQFAGPWVRSSANTPAVEP